MNKTVRRAKYDSELRIVYKKLVGNWSELRLFGYPDAGEGTRPSGLSQSGSSVMIGPKEVLEGNGIEGVLLAAIPTKSHALVPAATQLS